MRLKETVLLLAVIAFSGESVAFAQNPIPAAEPQPAEGSPQDLTEQGPKEAAPGPEAPPSMQPTPTPAPAQTNRIACVVGEHPSEYPDSARTATAMICDALRDRGVDIGPPIGDPRGSSAAYVVNLDQLGSTFFLRVHYEEPVGTVKKTRRISLSDLSEAEVAAPRIATALLENKKTSDTLAYDNVVGSEARNYRKKQGEFVIGAGIAAISMPAQGSYMGPAFELFGFYETDKWGIGLQGHTGDADLDPSEHASLAVFSAGARYYLTEENITPVIGAGLALSRISEHRHDNSYSTLEGSGTSAYAEAGVEMFRLHKTHLIATVRVDLPFYMLNRTADYGYTDYGSPSPAPTPTGPEKRYEVPITLNVGIGF